MIVILKYERSSQSLHSSESGIVVGRLVRIKLISNGLQKLTCYSKVPAEKSLVLISLAFQSNVFWSSSKPQHTTMRS